MPQVILAHTSAPPPRPSNINPNVSAAFNEVIARGISQRTRRPLRHHRGTLPCGATGIAGRSSRARHQHGDAALLATYRPMAARASTGRQSHPYPRPTCLANSTGAAHNLQGAGWFLRSSRPQWSYCLRWSVSQSWSFAVTAPARSESGRSKVKETPKSVCRPRSHLPSLRFLPVPPPAHPSTEVPAH